MESISRQLQHCDSPISWFLPGHEGIPAAIETMATLIEQGGADYWKSLSTSLLPYSNWQLNVSGVDSLPLANARYHSSNAHFALSFLDQQSVRPRSSLILAFEFRAS
jgi:hypothetical protein